MDSNENSQSQGKNITQTTEQAQDIKTTECEMIKKWGQRFKNIFTLLRLSDPPVDALVRMEDAFQVPTPQDDHLAAMNDLDKKMRTVFESQCQIHKRFWTWEQNQEKDTLWKLSIEEALQQAVKDQTTILDNVELKLDEMLRGKGQSEMMDLLLGTLNEMRDRLLKLENSVSNTTIAKS